MLSGNLDLSSLAGKSKEELMDMIISLSNEIYRQREKDVKFWIEYKSNFELMGDCIAQCLNCIRHGKDGYRCICDNQLLSMDSSAIRRTQEEYKSSKK